jgi:hypothetical protein
LIPVTGTVVVALDPVAEQEKSLGDVVPAVLFISLAVCRVRVLAEAVPVRDTEEIAKNRKSAR